METISTLFAIAALIIFCIVGISVIQRREQAKARLAELISKYRYRANEASRILENFAEIPIGNDARSLLLKFIHLNLLKIRQLSPNDGNVIASINRIDQQLQNPVGKIDKSNLSLPDNSDKLSLLIKNLSQLGRYLGKFSNISELSQKTPLAINRITLLIFEAKICAYMQQGKKSLYQHNYVNAQQNFQVAQKILAKITKKNRRFSELEKELTELTSQEVHKSIRKDLGETASKTTENEHMSKPELAEDDIFGPKKKW